MAKYIKRDQKSWIGEQLDIWNLVKWKGKASGKTLKRTLTQERVKAICMPIYYEQWEAQNQQNACLANSILLPTKRSAVVYHFVNPRTGKRQDETQVQSLALRTTYLLPWQEPLNRPFLKRRPTLRKNRLLCLRKMRWIPQVDKRSFLWSLKSKLLYTYLGILPNNFQWYCKLHFYFHNTCFHHEHPNGEILKYH